MQNALNLARERSQRRRSRVLTASTPRIPAFQVDSSPRGQISLPDSSLSGVKPDQQAMNGISFVG